MLFTIIDGLYSPSGGHSHLQHRLKCCEGEINGFNFDIIQRRSPRLKESGWERQWESQCAIKTQHDGEAELLYSRSDETFYVAPGSNKLQQRNEKLISWRRRIVRVLRTFLFYLPLRRCAKIRFKWLITWRRDRGRRMKGEEEGGGSRSSSSRWQLCTSLCRLNNTE